MRAIGLAALAVGFGILPALGGEPDSNFARIRDEMHFAQIRAEIIAGEPNFARIRAEMIAQTIGDVADFSQIRQQMIAQNIDEIMHRGLKSVEVVTFADPAHRPVTVIRGPSSPQPAAMPPAMMGKVEVVRFADSGRSAVTVIRGAGAEQPLEELFAPASRAELDLVAFAVDGAESSHGANLGMWRPELSGPQGPMQVSEAAATDVGGGDRFDIRQNRLLGRAYLAHLFRRYGNWADAVSAYNWGPGNVDGWIANGRPPDTLPLEVERYRDRVLRDAALGRSFDSLLGPAPGLMGDLAR